MDWNKYILKIKQKTIVHDFINKGNSLVSR